MPASLAEHSGYGRINASLFQVAFQCLMTQFRHFHVLESGNLEGIFLRSCKKPEEGWISLKGTQLFHETGASVQFSGKMEDVTSLSEAKSNRHSAAYPP